MLFSLKNLEKSRDEWYNGKLVKCDNFVLKKEGQDR
jgi:hypothetical protein